MRAQAPPDGPKHGKLASVSWCWATPMDSRPSQYKMTQLNCQGVRIALRWLAAKWTPVNESGRQATTAGGCKHIDMTSRTAGCEYIHARCETMVGIEADEASRDNRPMLLGHLSDAIGCLRLRLPKTKLLWKLRSQALMPTCGPELVCAAWCDARPLTHSQSNMFEMPGSNRCTT